MSTSSSSSESTDEKKTLTLRTSDGTFMEVEVAVAMEMATVKAFLHEKAAAATTGSSTNNPIIIVPLHKVASKELSKIVTYIRKYLELKGKSDSFNNIRAYNEEFLKDQSDYEINKEMIPTAFYLDIHYLKEALSIGLDTRLEKKIAEFVRERSERSRFTIPPPQRKYRPSVKPSLVSDPDWFCTIT